MLGSTSLYMCVGGPLACSYIILYFGGLFEEGYLEQLPRMQLADSVKKRAFTCINLQAACMEISYTKLIPQARETSTRLVFGAEGSKHGPS